MLLELDKFSIAVDFESGLITSFMIGGKERLAEPSLLFRIRLRDSEGKTFLITSREASTVKITDDGAIYGGFPTDVSVRVFLSAEKGEAAWRIKVTPLTENYFVEWVEFPQITLPCLEDNNTEGTGGKILFPYNEGALVSDMDNREESGFCYCEAEYPSKGLYAVFPNMVFAQILAYIWNDAGFYMGAHDKKRGVKDINFFKSEKGVTLRFRLYCGVDFGESFDMDYPIIFSITKGKWEEAAERYRIWFEENLPERVKKINENSALPEWYGDSPLVVTYPVRGLYDTDEMKPNKLYPYANVLPVLEKIKKECESRLLVLLMHWEGTAPWAPPYVWPPFGGTKEFNEFRDKLHEDGDLLGVYCSGFGYTLQSNLIDSYNKQKEYDEKELWRAMCASPEGEVEISKICQAQRSGYDICPASKDGRDLLCNAYKELFEGGIDYAQILDQNHGGGQYFCYSKNHGHPPSPGAWMTENMQNLLSEWNDSAGKMLLGCESSAAEPFIGNLLFSDNRYELNYHIGIPVPLYSYIYHQYLRNFMGNQVSCPFREQDDESILYRIAYSFSAGDAMTLVISDDGKVRTKWGKLNTDHLPNQEKILRLVKNLISFYKNEAKDYLFCGRMIVPPSLECGTAEFMRNYRDTGVTLPDVLGTAWEADNGSRVLILVNPFDRESKCFVNEKQVTIPPLDAVKISL